MSENFHDGSKIVYVFLRLFEDEGPVADSYYELPQHQALVQIHSPLAGPVHHPGRKSASAVQILCDVA